MTIVKARQYIRTERRRYQRAQSGKAWNVKDLPQYYYLDNFLTVLNRITSEYQHLLGKNELRFLTDFRALPHPAQCTYVRIASRKGFVFDTRKLQYPEITTLDKQYSVLRRKGFISELSKDNFSDYLNAILKSDLILLLSDHLCETQFKKSWPKASLIDVALNNLDFDDIVVSDNFIVQRKTQTLYFLLYLYFGRIERNLQTITLKDLGLVNRPEFAGGSNSIVEGAYYGKNE